MKLEKDLLDPRAYPDQRPKKVALAETHISWVFLLEDDVFKVKKPVDMGFLDFRTLEARKAACEAEVEQNRRLSPDVYRGVVPVRRDEDGVHTLGAEGTIVDWAVHMTRLPDERRGSALLVRGELTTAAIDLIARKLAAFHASARQDAHTARFGTTRAVLENLKENFAQTDEVLERYLDPSQADELVAWQGRFVRDHAGLFERRILEGRIRDGHGDLRLDQLYVHPDDQDVTILDCIEFNERFRFADVCADVAFLSMDLAARGRVDLAERFLAAYSRESNDFDMYALVDFYESYRAYVRGKIAAMMAGDTTLPLPERQKGESDARRYFLLALSADRRSLLRPAVVVVGGVIASGKSSISERLGAAMSAPVIDADRTRKALLGVGPSEPIREGAWKGAYSPPFTQRVYAEILRRAGIVLESGRPVVLDASFRSALLRRAARDLARSHGVPFRFVECRADAAVCRARLREREQRPGVSDGRLAIFDAFRESFEPVVELGEDELTVIDTTRPRDETDAALRAAVETWPGGLVA